MPNSTSQQLLLQTSLAHTWFIVSRASSPGSFSEQYSIPLRQLLGNSQTGLEGTLHVANECIARVLACEMQAALTGFEKGTPLHDLAGTGNEYDLR
jgi:hypothetical protein